MSMGQEAMTDIEKARMLETAADLLDEMGERDLAAKVRAAAESLAQQTMF